MDKLSLNSSAGPSDTGKVDLRTISSFAEFYPHYLAEHTNRTSRRLHFVGTSLVILCIVYSVISAQAVYLWALPFLGYGFAWIGHYVFEKNRPATFTRPLYSLMGDWVMYAQMWQGKVSL